MSDDRFSAEWVNKQREGWRKEPLTTEDIDCYRVNYDIPGWHDFPNSLPFGAALAIERLCCEIERLQIIITDRDEPTSY